MSKFMKILRLMSGLLLLMTGLMFTGCHSWHHVEGNYDVQTETRQLETFERVANEGSFDVYIIQDGHSEVEIEAESNLIPLIRTRVQGSTLVIDTKDDLRNNYPMKLYVHTGDLNEVNLSGSGLMHADNIVTGDFEASISGSGDIFISGTANDVKTDISGSGSIDLGIECDELEVDISGSGEMEIWGTANHGDFDISGSGSIHAYELTLKECNAKISGSGSMYLTVEDHLNVNISGSGNIYYIGNPVLDINISGSGSVIQP
jgi:hypothetical protein